MCNAQQGNVVFGMCINEGGDRCSHIKGLSDSVCECYANPSGWHRRGGCPMNTLSAVKAAKKKVFVNPIKASKRNG